MVFSKVNMAAWSSGMILASGARGPGLNSRSSPCLPVASSPTGAPGCLGPACLFAQAAKRLVSDRLAALACPTVCRSVCGCLCARARVQGQRRKRHRRGETPGRKRLRVKGVGPNSGEGPGAQHPENEANQNSFRGGLKVFGFFWRPCPRQPPPPAPPLPPGRGQVLPEKRAGPKSGEGRGGQKQQTKKPRKGRKQKKTKAEKKTPAKQNACASKGFAPKAAKARAAKTPKKKTRKGKKAKGREARAANPPARQNTCTSKGLARKAAKAREPNTTKTKLTKTLFRSGLKVFGLFFWASLPAAASSPPGEGQALPEKGAGPRSGEGLGGQNDKQKNNGAN